MRLPWGKIAIGALVVVVSFGGAVGVMSLTSGSGSGKRPVLVEVPPLEPVTRTSVIVTPAAIALTAIRDAMEAKAPRDLTGKRDNPLSQLLKDAELGWTIARGPLAVAGRPEALQVSTVAQRHVSRDRSDRRQGRRPHRGHRRAVRRPARAGPAGASPARRSTSVPTSAATSRSRRGRRCCRRGGSSPISPARCRSPMRRCRSSGVRLSVANEVKPLLDRAVNEQIAAAAGARAR